MRLVLPATTDNKRNRMQQELGLISAVTSQLADIQANAVSACETEQEALRLCVARANPYRSQSDIAELIGINHSVLNRMLNADHHHQPRYMSRVLQIKLQQVCGNRAVDQWADLYAKGMLNCQRTVADREAELVAELNKLREAREKLEQFK